MWRRVANDERGLSTLEWILLVAAVGGLATAGVIIVRNAVGGAGDQVDDTARNERMAQIDVNDALRRLDTGNRVGGTTQAIEDSRIEWDDVQDRCSYDRQYDDGTYPLRRWRGSFTLRVVREEKTNPGTVAVGTGATQMLTTTAANMWCDAVPTNNLDNNPADFAEPIRLNYGREVCVRWPDDPLGTNQKEAPNKAATKC